MIEKQRRLLDAVPDGVVAVGPEGRIRWANDQMLSLLGYSMEEIVELHVEDLVPEGARARHADLRSSFLERPVTRPMAAGQNLYARRKDGSEVPVDIALAPLVLDNGDKGAVAFVRDATARVAAESRRQEDRDARLRRKHALELNDNVIQGLGVIGWLLDDGKLEEARHAVAATLASAKILMEDHFAASGEVPKAGDLRRNKPARSVLSPELISLAVPPSKPEGGEEVGDSAAATMRVVIVDDAEDLRYLLREQLLDAGAFTVVAEAADGAQGVAAVAEHQPDAVILDLSMPVMDGLEAAAHIRAADTEVRIVVLTGNSDPALRLQAMTSGADVFLEKGCAFEEIVRALTEPVETLGLSS